MGGRRAVVNLFKRLPAAKVAGLVPFSPLRFEL